MNKLIHPILISIATMFLTAIFSPTPAHAITGEEAVKVIRVFGDYMDNLHKIFQPAPPTPTPSQPDNPIPNPGMDEPQPEPDITEYQFN
jgi:hypothetical protein